MSWHCKARGAYAQDSTEAIENAQEIANIFISGCGWTKNAVAGFLGNVGGESGYNPWRWQSDNVQPIANNPWHNIGYGLTQFTPGGKYINSASSYTGYGPNFSDQAGKDTDGAAQCWFLNKNADYYSTSNYPLSYSEYKASTESAEYLSTVWLYNYERPNITSELITERRQYAAYWYQVLEGYTPTPPTPGGGSSWRYGAAREIIRRLILHA